MKNKILILSAILLFSLTNLIGVYAEEKIKVMASILPLAEFAEHIGRDKVEVNIMVLPGASPHTYEPTPSQLQQLSEAELYIKADSGIEFEITWMDKLRALNKSMLICKSTAGLDLLEMNGHHHQHRDTLDQKHHQGKDPHVWLAPLKAITMVKNIQQALLELDPADEAFYVKNAGQYISELKKLHQEIKEKLASKTNRTFMVFHPSWGYFAKDYNLTQLVIETEGKEPTARKLVELTKKARQAKIKTIFVSPQFNPKSAEVIAKEIKGQVVSADPLAKNYIKNLSELTDILYQSLE